MAEELHPVINFMERGLQLIKKLRSMGIFVERHDHFVDVKELLDALLGSGDDMV